MLSRKYLFNTRYTVHWLIKGFLSWLCSGMSRASLRRPDTKVLPWSRSAHKLIFILLALHNEGSWKNGSVFTTNQGLHQLLLMLSETDLSFNCLGILVFVPNADASPNCTLQERKAIKETICKCTTLSFSVHSLWMYLRNWYISYRSKNIPRESHITIGMSIFCGRGNIPFGCMPKALWDYVEILMISTSFIKFFKLFKDIIVRL